MSENNPTSYFIHLTESAFHKIIPLIEDNFNGAVNYGANESGEVYVELSATDEIDIIPINFQKEILERCAIIDSKIERAKRDKRKLSLLKEKEALLTTLGVIDEVISRVIELESGE